MSERDLAQESINRQIAEQMGDVVTALAHELSVLPISERAKDLSLNIIAGNSLLVKGRTVTVMIKVQPQT